MKIIFNNTKKQSIIKRYAIYLLIAIALSLIDIILLDFISIDGLTPDLLLIFCVWVSLSEGQFEGMIMAFTFGLIFDILSLDVLGTNALANTFVGLIAGWFYKENKVEQNIGSFRFLFIVFISSVAHNLIYFFLYVKFTNLAFIPFFGKYGLAISFYTTVLAIFPMLLKMPKNRLIR